MIYLWALHVENFPQTISFKVLNPEKCIVFPWAQLCDENVPRNPPRFQAVGM